VNVVHKETKAGECTGGNTSFKGIKYKNTKNGGIKPLPEVAKK
jgi:hypothetical protein